MAGLLCGFHDARDQRIADSLGEVPCQRRGIQRFAHLLGVMGQIHHRRFQAGKAHIQRGTLHMGMGQGVDTAPGLLGQLVHGRAAGVGKSQHSGRLVKAFPRRIVPGRTQNFQIRIIPDVHDHGVAPGDGQCQEGWLQLREGQIVGGDMAPDMVHRDQRHPKAVGHGFGKAQAHQYSPDETGGVGDGHGVNVLPGAAGVRQGFFCQGRDHFNMLAGGQLRYHAAIQSVEVRLRCNGIGQHPPSVLHHCHGGLVAGGFKG